MNVYVHNQVREVQKFQRQTIERTTSKTTVIEQLESLAENLHSQFHKGNRAVATIISNWHPDFVGKDVDSILASGFSESDAKLSIAREHGFPDWKKVEESGDSAFSLEFEDAVDTLLNGDMDSLASTISDNPALLKERSNYGHQATLLHYVSSNGCETRRQVVPLNLPEIAGLLIEKGADKEAKMRVYGGEFTALQLAATSAHPKEAGIMDDLIKVLEVT